MNTNPFNLHMNMAQRARAATPWLVAAAAMLVAPAMASARTVLLDIEHCDQAAVIHAEAPRLSWAGDREPHHATFVSARVRLTEQSAMLMRFNFDAIPSDQRIVHAELLVPVTGTAGNEPRFYLWRVLADWGPGVSHLYRYIDVNADNQEDEKVPWTKPGARGIATDRATRPTDIVRIAENERIEKVINVTEDVELWYENRAPNHGWLFTVEDPETSVSTESPIYENAEQWTLRITYEPRDD